MSAGGHAQTADLRNAKLIRATADGQPLFVTVNIEALLKGDATKDLPVEPGDILYIDGRTPKRGFGLMDALSFLPFIGYFRR